MGVFFGVAGPEAASNSLSLPPEFQETPFHHLQWQDLQAPGIRLLRARTPSSLDPPARQVGPYLVAWDGTLLYRGDACTPFQPTEAELQALLQDPARQLQHLKGWFALMVYDPRQHRLLLATDWMGLRAPAYRWHPETGRFFFGTWILPLGPEDAEPAALLEYFFLNYPLGARTLARNFRRVPAGHFVLWQEGRPPEVQRYYHHRQRLFEVDLRSDLTRRRLTEVFVETTRALARDAEPAGLLLTGGFDSRVVLAALRSARRPVLALTLGDPASRNVATARRVARAAGARFQNLDPNPVFRRHFFPWARRNTLATDGLEVATKAHYLWGLASLQEPPPVLLSGTGGSELFRQTGVLGNIYSPLLVVLLTARRALTLEDLAAQPQAAWLHLETLAAGLPGLHQDLAPLLEVPPDRRAAFFHGFNLAELFARYFENEMRMEQWFTVKRFPFLDLDLVEQVFASAEVSPLRSHLFQKSRRAPLQRLGFYAEVLRRTLPALARVATDRGIRPDYAWNPWGFLRSAWGYWRYRRHRGPGEYRFGEWLQAFPLDASWPCEPPVRRQALARALQQIQGTARPFPPGAARALTFCLWQALRSR